MKSGFVLVVLFLMGFPAFADTCLSVLTDQKVKLLAEFLTRDNLSSDHSWPGYKPSAFPIYFLDQKNFPNCMAVWMDGKITAQPIASEIESPGNGVYGYCGQIGSRCPKTNTGVVPTVAMIYRLDNVLDNPDLIRLGFVPPKLDFTMIAHEGFHVFGQSSLRTSDNWVQIPNLEQMPDRQQLMLFRESRYLRVGR